MKRCMVDGRWAARWIGAAGVSLWVAACGPVVEPGEEGDDTGGDSSSNGSGVVDDTTGAGPTTTSVSLSGPQDEATTDTPAQPNISGDHLLAISVIIAPETPLQFLATVSHEDGILRMSLQPLSLDPQATTTPRLPVGDPLDANGEIADDGTFVLDLGEVSVRGASNPITGSDIVATLRLEGRVDSPDSWCGDVSGFVSQPLMLDLTGSTFAGTRIVGELPGDPIVAACGR